MNINKLFNKNLTIITKDEKTYHIQYKEVLIHDSSSFNGKANVIEKDNNVYLIKEVYSLERNRLRYSYTKYENVKSYNTIEKDSEGHEKPILVVENFKRKTTQIGSIGNIVKIDSDIKSKENDKPLILKLIRRNKKTNEVDELMSA